MTKPHSETVMMYCDPCGDDREFRREIRNRRVDVRGEGIDVKVPMLVCGVCGATQPDVESGVDAISLANDEYRRRHQLLSSDDIRRIREKYDLSREAFAEVLGMSPATLYRYEGGAIQDEVQDSAIFACDDPATMERLVRRKDNLTPLQLRRFHDAIARGSGRLVTDVLTEAIEVSLDPLGLSGADARPLTAWSDQEVVAAATATMSVAEDRKLSDLLERQQTGTLTPDEREALRGLMQVYQEGLLQKAQGLSEAVRRGLLAGPPAS